MDQATKKILIVEDDPLTVKIIQSHLLQSQMLRRVPCTILIAVDVEEGLAKVRAENPDVILLDLLLPGRSGFELLEAIKADQAVQAIPVIVLSNLGQEED